MPETITPEYTVPANVGFYPENAHDLDYGGSIEMGYATTGGEEFFQVYVDLGDGPQILSVDEAYHIIHQLTQLVDYADSYMEDAIEY